MVAVRFAPLVLMTVLFACSGSSDDDGSGGAFNGTGASGGSGNATSGGSGNATSGGSGNATSGGSGNATSGGSGNATSGGGSGGALGGAGTGGSGDGGMPTGGVGTGGAGTGGSPADPYAQARIDCVARINGFRATLGLAPLTRWTAQEACSDEQAEADSTSGAHANFGDCGEGAQNTCPGWGSIDSIIQGCLQMMWDEGPGEPYSEHGHYINMSNPDYTQVACGFYEMPNGEIWASQNFR